MDVDLVIDPLRQIVPTLLDVPYTTDDVVVLRPTSNIDERLMSTLQEDSSQSTGDTHDTVAPSPTDAVPVSTDAAQNTDVDTVESVDEPTSSTDTDPAETASDVKSVPHVVSESDSTAGVTGHALDGEET